MSNIIDSSNKKEEIRLFSKSSIFLVSLFMSPLFGGILYCRNLIVTNQKNKVLGTYLAIFLSTFFTNAIFYQFNFTLNYYSPITFLTNLLISLFIIYPLWTKQFQLHSYKSFFPLISFALTCGYFLIFSGYNMWRLHFFDFLPKLPSYFPYINYWVLFHVISLTLFGKFVRDLFILTLKKCKQLFYFF